MASIDVTLKEHEEGGFGNEMIGDYPGDGETPGEDYDTSFGNIAVKTIGYGAMILTSPIWLPLSLAYSGFRKGIRNMILSIYSQTNRK